MRTLLRTISFKGALKFWTKLGFISFGGPAGQIANMHEEVVERRGPDRRKPCGLKPLIDVHGLDALISSGMSLALLQRLHVPIHYLAP